MALTKVSRGLISTSIVDNGNATAITIDSSENVSFTGAGTFSGDVGIGGSPSKPLHVFGPDGAGEGTPTLNANVVAVFQNNGTSADGTILNILSGSASTGFIGFGTATDDIRQAIVANMSDDSLELRTGNNSTALTIGTSGNLLVGKTASAIGTAGTEIYGTGVITSTRAGNILDLNRLSTPGNIAQFRADGAVVGSIGVVSGDRLYIATGDGLGLQFDKDNNRIIPCDASGGVNSNVELGDSGLEFTNLWLSGNATIGGGVFLGGTGAANKLDDYEEGTFTATLKGGSIGSVTATIAEYTKIGDTVHCRVAFLNVDTTGYSGHLRVEGLPFPMKNSNLRNVCTPAMYQIGAFTADYVIGLVEASTHVNFYGVKSANTWNTVTHNAGGNRYLEFNVTYNVA